MTETVVNLKPESAWRPGMTREKLIGELDHAAVPGQCAEHPGQAVFQVVQHPAFPELADRARLLGAAPVIHDVSQPAVDGAAFAPFWRLDGAGLTEALRAVPTTRFRVTPGRGGAPVGYAISGRAGRQGYLQRLAVDPAHQGQGHGQVLVADALHWMRKPGVARAVVNTQLGNEAALALYGRLGFRLQPSGLAVLRRALR